MYKRQGLYGFCAARWQNRDRWPVAETVSKASFCIYLTHLFFLDFLAGRGLSAGTLPPVWGVPVDVYKRQVKALRATRPGRADQAAYEARLAEEPSR